MADTAVAVFLVGSLHETVDPLPRRLCAPASMLLIDWPADHRLLLANGDFSSGVKCWLLAIDQDIAWHIHLLAVEIYFAQGLLGLAAFAALTLAAARGLSRRFGQEIPMQTPQPQPWQQFFRWGCSAAPMDTARLSILLYFGTLAGGLLLPPRGQPAAN